MLAKFFSGANVIPAQAKGIIDQINAQHTWQQRFAPTQPSWYSAGRDI
jgi:hypothetical protein